jgi:hypothetical protein
LEPTSKPPLMNMTSRGSVHKADIIVPPSLWHRLSPLLSVVVATAVAGLALYAWHTDLSFGNGTYVYRQAAYNRSGVQVVVTIMSSLLAALLTTSLSTLINLWKRAAITESLASINSLRLLTAMSKGYIDFSLPNARLPVSVLFWACALAPAWLWTGGLTPRISTATDNTTLPLARVGTGSYDFLQPTYHDPISN